MIWSANYVHVVSAGDSTLLQYQNQKHLACGHWLHRGCGNVSLMNNKVLQDRFLTLAQ